MNINKIKNRIVSVSKIVDEVQDIIGKNRTLTIHKKLAEALEELKEE